MLANGEKLYKEITSKESDVVEAHKLKRRINTMLVS